MPYTRQELLAALRADHPELKQVEDNKLFAAIAVDHPDLAKGISELMAAPKPQSDDRTATQVMQDQAAQVLKGVPTVVTGIPSTLKALGGMAVDTVMGRPGKVAADLGTMATGAVQPVTASLKGMATLAKPGSFMPPTREEWEQAAQGAGATLAGAELPNVMSMPIVQTGMGKTASAASAAATGAANAGSKVVEGARSLLGMGELEPKAALIKAIKPYVRKVDFDSKLDLAMPELKAAEATIGKPITDVDTLIEATKAAKKNVWSQYEQMAGTAAGTKVSGRPIADAIVDSIPEKIRLKNPAQYLQLRQDAAFYRNKFDIGDLESILHDTNAELDGYYNKYPTARRQAVAANPETAMLEAEARAIRKTIYQTIDPAGQGGAPAALKKRYGALLEVEEEAWRRKNVAMRQQPESLTQQLGRLQAGIELGKAGVQALSGDVVGAGTRVAGAWAARKMADAIKEANSTNTLIESAFKNYTTTPTPVALAPTGGPLFAGAPAQAAPGATPPAAPPPAPTGQMPLTRPTVTGQLPLTARQPPAAPPAAPPVPLQNMQAPPPETAPPAAPVVQPPTGAANVPLSSMSNPTTLPPKAPTSLADLQAKETLPDWVTEGTGSDSPKAKIGKNLPKGGPTDEELTKTAKIRMAEHLEQTETMRQRPEWNSSATQEEGTKLNAHGIEEQEAAADARKDALFEGYGVKSKSPVADFPESADEITAAIESGKGALYKRVLEAFKESARAEWKDWVAEKTAGAKKAANKALEAQQKNPLAPKPVSLKDLLNVPEGTEVPKPGDLLPGKKPKPQ